MNNCEMSVDGNKLVIMVDLSQDFGPSVSGKSIIIASTGGNSVLPGTDVIVGLNIFRKAIKKG